MFSFLLLVNFYFCSLLKLSNWESLKFSVKWFGLRKNKNFLQRDFFANCLDTDHAADVDISANFASISEVPVKFDSLLKNKVFDINKLKAFAENKINATQVF